MGSTRSTKKGFDFLSSFYDLLILFGSGNLIVKSQIAFIPKLNNPKKVLLIGDGTGNFLKNLLRRSNPGHIVYIDISAGMIHKAQKKIKNLPVTCLIDFRQGGFEMIKDQETFDLVVTNYFLDLFPKAELEKNLSRLYGHLKEGGHFYITDFNSELKGWKKVLFYPIIKTLYLLFRLICNIPGKKLPAIFETVSLFNMKEIASRKFFFGLLRSDLYVK